MYAIYHAFSSGSLFNTKINHTSALAWTFSRGTFVHDDVPIQTLKHHVVRQTAESIAKCQLYSHLSMTGSIHEKCETQLYNSWPSLHNLTKRPNKIIILLFTVFVKYSNTHDISHNNLCLCVGGTHSKINRGCTLNQLPLPTYIGFG